jgi:hypothetical protein
VTTGSSHFQTPAQVVENILLKKLARKVRSIRIPWQNSSETEHEASVATFLAFLEGYYKEV